MYGNLRKIVDGTGKSVKIALLVIYDILAVIACEYLALLVRYDFKSQQIEMRFLEQAFRGTPICILITLVIFALAGLYSSLWRYASVRELLLITVSCICSIVLQLIVYTMLSVRMPRSYYFIYLFLNIFFTIGIRYSYRLLRAMESRFDNAQKRGNGINTMIIGAGDAGAMLVKEYQTSKYLSATVCCIIDDDERKRGTKVNGVLVVGNRTQIPLAVEKYQIQEIVLAIPTATAGEKKDILEICKNTGCKLKTIPGIYQVIKDEVSVSKLREVQIEDLLGREPIRVNLEIVLGYVQGKTVLVTGGGGSIGSELCRQIAAHNPKQLIVLDVYENNAYDIQMELRKKYPKLDLQTIIASVRDSRKMFQVFETYRPEIVYHAAAHKHVPLMEDSPCEAIKNNAIGTYKTAYAAMTHGCQRFVLISTDKAVNPTNIMGASKRLCEMVIQAFDNKIKQGKADEIPQLFTHEMKQIITAPEIKDALQNTKTEFVAVRFGNVLGSNGSVIPLFKKQIEAGGPVTVTDPNIIRYFMTIPEAVSLVLQAGAYAKGGEIFVLDMGEPVKIDDLARNLIKLSGYKPDQDIKIEYTGLRPGEKLYEEKLMAEEGLKKTENDLIHIGCPIPFDTEEFLRQLSSLMDVAYKNKGDIRKYVQEIVTTYQPKAD